MLQKPGISFPADFNFFFAAATGDCEHENVCTNVIASSLPSARREL
jgi:hypothetical protein